MPRRAFVLLGVILAVASTSVAVFALSDHLALIDAIYWTWRPRDDRSVEAGVLIAVVGTRRACDELLAA